MANYQYINDTGTIVPDTSEIQSGIQQEYRNAFGQDLNVDPQTPQGLLITAETIARSEVVSNNAALANQINPNIAGGIFLDAILALTGAQRNPEIKTLVSGCVLQGLIGTSIPAGVQAKNVDTGDIYESLNTVTLSGSPPQAIVDFRSIIPGPLTIAINKLTQIVTPVLGWDTINNPIAGVPGSEQQSDASARSLRKVTLASQGSSLAGAIISALFQVEGVSSLSFRENVTDSTIVIDGVTLVPHSMYACVEGGSEVDVATAILSKKSGGCNYNGTVTFGVVEQYSGQIFDVKFDRPAEVDILIKVTYRLEGSVEDPEDSIRNAILVYTSGQLEGFRGFIVGENVSAFEIAGAITCQIPGIYIKEVQTAINSGSPVFSTDEIPILISQIAFTEDSMITVLPA